jgi:hypothetical protein
LARIRAKTSTRDAQIAEAILDINTKKCKSIAEVARAFKLDKEKMSNLPPTPQVATTAPSKPRKRLFYSTLPDVRMLEPLLRRSIL